MITALTAGGIGGAMPPGTGPPVSPIPGTSAAGTGGAAGQQPPGQQGLAALLVMIAVLAFILAYCFWGAPWCRRRTCPCLTNSSTSLSARDDGATASSGAVTPTSLTGAAYRGTGVSGTRGSTPTIILLPYGRMLVVDGSVIAQFQADTRGLDLVELGESIARSRHRQRQFHQSALSVLDSVNLDSDSSSKDALSPIYYSPPTYDSIFGPQPDGDMPPSYSEVSFQLRQLASQITRELRYSEDNLLANKSHTHAAVQPNYHMDRSELNRSLDSTRYGRIEDVHAANEYRRNVDSEDNLLVNNRRNVVESSSSRQDRPHSGRTSSDNAVGQTHEETNRRDTLTIRENPIAQENLAVNCTRTSRTNENHEGDNNERITTEGHSVNNDESQTNEGSARRIESTESVGTPNWSIITDDDMRESRV